jgi:hypothetical protein
VVRMKRIYVETCIFSEGRLPKGRLIANMNSLVAEASNSAVTFVTSPSVRQELEAIKDDDLRALAIAEVGRLRLMHYSAGPIALGGPGLVFVVPFEPVSDLQLELGKLFDFKDTEHIFQAVKAGCDVFLTEDTRTILRRVKRNQERVRDLCGTMEFMTIDELRLRLEALQDGATKPCTTEGCDGTMARREDEDHNPNIGHAPDKLHSGADDVWVCNKESEHRVRAE